jgi:hypothetical protein
MRRLLRGKNRTGEESVELSPLETSADAGSRSLCCHLSINDNLTRQMKA